MDSYKPLSPQIFSIFILVPITIDDFYAETRPLNEMLISRNIKKSNSDIVDMLTYFFATRFCKQAPRDSEEILLLSHPQAFRV